MCSPSLFIKSGTSGIRRIGLKQQDVLFKRSSGFIGISFDNKTRILRWTAMAFQKVSFLNNGNGFDGYQFIGRRSLAMPNFFIVPADQIE
jgi:hypothetical protein